MNGAAIFSETSRITNPFSTRWVRPGALPYQFPPGADAATLVASLRDCGWRGAIIGPHGSGKTALLASLLPEIQRAGQAVRPISLHDGQRRLPADFAWPGRDEPLGVIVIDGYEQLAWPARFRLSQHCRRSGWGLLVTAHGETSAPSLPVLFRTATDLATVTRLIACHLPPYGGRIQADEIAAAFRAHRGNVRDTFFALYDLFEHRRQVCACETAGVSL